MIRGRNLWCELGAGADGEGEGAGGKDLDVLGRGREDIELCPRNEPCRTIGVASAELMRVKVIDGRSLLCCPDV